MVKRAKDNSLVSMLHAQKSVVANEINHLHIYPESSPPLTPLDPFATVPPCPANFMPRPKVSGPVAKVLLSRSPKARITALLGMGGVGKTAIALGLCNDMRIRKAFPDGVVWLTIGKEANVSVEKRIEYIATALNQEFRDYSEVTYRSMMQGKTVLVVLDDVWTLEAVQPFRLGLGESRLLYTSRNRDLAGQLGAESYEVPVLQKAQARNFLVRRLGRKRTGLPEPYATEILEQCKGLILGLAMLGAALEGEPDREWHRMLSYLKKSQLKQIDGRPDGYGFQTLHASIAASVDVLDPVSKARYMRLAVLLEDMAAPEVLLRAIWGGEEEDVQRTRRLLEDRSLATRDAQDNILLHDFQLDFLRAEDPYPVALALQHSALLRSIDVMRSHPEQFASQMIGRLLPHAREPGIAVFLKDLDAFEQRPRIRPLIPTLDAAGSTVLRVLEGHTGRVYAVALTPDGRLAVSGSEDNTLRVWDVDGTLPPRILEGHTGPVLAVALTPDGKLAVSGSSDRTLRVWDLGGKIQPHVLEGHTDWVSSVALTPDGKSAVSGSGDGTLRVWDLGGILPPRVLEGHTGPVRAVALRPDGKLAVSGSSDRTLRVWDLGGTEPPRLLEGHTGSIRAVALTPDGKLAVSGSDDGTLRVWNLNGNKPPRVLGANDDHVPEGVNAIALSRDGRLAFCGYDRGRMRVWDLAGTKSPRVLEGHIGYVFAVAMTPDGSLAVSGSLDKTLKVWSLEGPRVLNRHTTSVHAVILTLGKDGSGSPDRMLRAWNLAGTQTTCVPEAYPTRIDALALTPDGKLALSNSDWKLRLWDLDGNKPPRVLEGHHGIVVAVALTPDGSRAVAGSNDDALWVWDLNRTQPPRVLEGHTDTVFAVALTHDGRLAVSGSEDMTLRVWDLDGTKKPRVLEGHTGWVSSVALTPDGSRAVSGSYDKTLRVWDLDSNKALRVLEGHTDSIHAVAVTPDGKLVVSGSEDNTIRVWNLVGREPSNVLEGHTARVEAVAVTPDGKLVVSGSKDKTLRVWNLEEGKCIATFTCDAVVRSCWWMSNEIPPGDGRGQVCFFLWEDVNVEAQP